MLLQPHDSEFAENWALQSVTKTSTPIIADCKAEFLECKPKTRKLQGMDRWNLMQRTQVHHFHRDIALLRYLDDGRIGFTSPSGQTFALKPGRKCWPNYNSRIQRVDARLGPRSEKGHPALTANHPNQRLPRPNRLVINFCPVVRCQILFQRKRTRPVCFDSALHKPF